MAQRQRGQRVAPPPKAEPAQEEQKTTVADPAPKATAEKQAAGKVRKFVNVTPYQQWNHVAKIMMYPNNAVACEEDSWIKANMAAGLIVAVEE